MVASTSKDTYKPGGNGQEEGFGGSIDMLTLVRRINYINESGKKTYNASFENASSGGFNWLENSTYIDLSSGSYLPINIDLETTKLDDISGKTDTSNSYYSNNTIEPVLKTNSGYLTGGNARFRAQASNKDNQGIKYAVKRESGTTTASSGKNFDLFSDSDGKVISEDKLNSNVAFLTYSFTDKYVCAIYDNDNEEFIKSSNFVYKVLGSDITNKNYISSTSFKDYSSVKKNFMKMLYDSTNAYYNNGGNKYRSVYLPSVRFQQWSNDSTFSAKVQWPGESEEKNITFHNNGFQFQLNGNGYITAIVSKYDSSGNFVFYNLYSVDLENNSKLTKINTVHKDSTGNISYNQSDENSKIFDFSPLSTANTGLYSSQLFYFEIPVKKGTYFLSTYGSSYTSSYYPYLLYLDIGANAGDDGSSGETVTRTKVFELLKQITEAFTYPTGVYVTDFDNAALDTKTLCITLGSTYSGKVTISMSGNNANLVVNSDSSTNTGISYYDLDFTLSNNGSEITSSDIIEGEQSTITTKRMTYYDYNSDDSTLRMFRFSQSKTDEEEYGEITAETQYYATYSDSSLSAWTKTSGETVYNDDGTSTEETNGIPSPLATEGIAIPTDYSESSNVFDLQLKVNKKDTFTSTYLPAVTLGENNLTSVYGYDFEMKNGENKISSNDYNLTRNDKYYLKINDEEYKQA